ncbi:MAG: hypothetical protein K0S65_1073, partial [Labilithrix sp.]|nr:hypothetical protein [Labilithrix sp.]
MRRLTLTSILTLASVAVTGIARADDAATADKLFAEANALVSEGRYAEACPKLAESQRIEPAVGTQFNLADCYEHLGKTATAFALFSDVARIARAAGKFERERRAKERATALEAHLAHVRIVPQAPAPGLEIKIDDVVLPRQSWATAFPIDPGDHHIVASAPSRTSWEGTTKATADQSVEVAIPELVDPTPRPQRAETRPAPSSTQRTIAIAVAGAGVAGLAVGAIAGAMALSARGRAEDACPSSRYDFRCPTTQGTDDWNSATTAGNVSTVGFIVG